MNSQSAAGLLSPSSTVFRVRRKRGADPLAGLVVLSKKPKTNEPAAESSPTTEQPPATEQNAVPELASCSNQEIIFRLVGTSELPNVKGAARFLDRDHKVVEMVDYNPEHNSLGKRRISVLDRQYLEVMEAAKAISSFGLDEQDFEKESTAPLAIAEVDEEETPSTSVDGKEYVYDFYCPADNKLRVISENCYEVRLPTDEELQLFYGGEDEDGSDHAADDDEDSNDENHYKNDYPEEDEFANCENDTTSDDDSYDHYGDENENYADVCQDSDVD